MRSSNDGYRLIVRRDGAVVCLFTRRGHDWTDRYPSIAGGAAMLRARSLTLDGEAVVCSADGLAVFDALHRRHKAADAILYAFDLLELNGKDLRPMPLSERRPSWPGYRASAGIVFNEHTDEDGAVVFRNAFKLSMGHRVEATERALPIRTLPQLDQKSRTRTARRWCGTGKASGRQYPGR